MNTYAQSSLLKIVFFSLLVIASFGFRPTTSPYSETAGPTSFEADSTQIQMAYAAFQTALELSKQRKYEEALPEYFKALDTYQQLALNDKENANHFATCFSKCLRACLAKGNFQEGYNTVNKYTGALEQVLSQHDSLLAETYMGSARVYRNMGHYEQSIAFDQKAVDLFLKSEGRKGTNTSRAYYGIAVTLYRQTNFDKALEYLDKCLAINLLAYGEKSEHTSRVYQMMGIVYRNQNRFEEALKYYLRALAVDEKLHGADSYQVARLYQNIGNIHYFQHEYDKAINAYQKLVDIGKKIHGKNHLNVALAYSNIASAYGMIGEHEKALNYFDEVLEIYLKSFTPFHRRVAMLYNSIGSIRAEMKEYETALGSHQKAFESLVLGFESTSIHDLPDINAQINSKSELLETISHFVNVLAKKYEYEKQEEDLEAILKTVALGTDLVDIMKLEHKRAGSKMQVINTAMPIYELGILHTLENHESHPDKTNMDAVFSFMEKSKATLLLESLRDIEAISNVPAEKLQELDTIKVQLNTIEKEYLQEVAEEQTDTMKMFELKDQIFDLKKERDDLIAAFEKKYPDYFQLKYDKSSATISDVQAFLPNEETALIEYLVGDSLIYAFVIGKNNYEIVKIDRDTSLSEDVNKLLRATYSFHLNPSRTQEMKQRYADSLAQTSYQIYQKIFAPVAAAYDLPPHLIIIPDGVLGYVPFDMLLQETPQDNNAYGLHRYLINDYQISYAYSATLLKEMMSKKHRTTKGDFLAFAPSFENTDEPKIYADAISNVRGDLSPLQFNVPEVEALKNMLGGKVFKGLAATKERFLSEAPFYKIIHLATHGKADDKVGDFAYLAFTATNDSIENELLYTRDLYNMRLNSDMLVLSACETGIGKLQKGEGIISLARGFSYAGAKSIITTLWSVNDNKTKELMESFYTHLKTGKTKDAALRQAKLDFLDKYSHEAHPFFWAGFIPIGDMEAINLSENRNRIYWIGLVFVLVLGAIIARRLWFN